jgi:hypothetical protein
MYLLNSFLFVLAIHGCLGRTPAPKVEFAFVNIETVLAAEMPGDAQHMAPGIVVRLYDDSRKREAFALSNEVGIAIVPLRPGSYCFEAFEQDGHHLTLDQAQSRCFDLALGQFPTVGVVFAKRRR